MDDPVQDGEGMAPDGHVEPPLRVLGHKAPERTAALYLIEVMVYLLGQFLNHFAEGDAPPVLAAYGAERLMAARIWQASSRGQGNDSAVPALVEFLGPEASGVGIAVHIARFPCGGLRPRTGCWSVVDEVLREIPQLLVELHVCRRRGDAADAVVAASTRDSLLNAIEDAPQIVAVVFLAANNAKRVELILGRLAPAKTSGLHDECHFDQRMQLDATHGLDGFQHFGSATSNGIHGFMRGLHVALTMNQASLEQGRSSNDSVAADKTEEPKRNAQRGFPVMAVDDDDLRLTLVACHRHDVVVAETHNVFLEPASLSAVGSADLGDARDEPVLFQVTDDAASRYESVLIACGLSSVTCLKRSQCRVVVEVANHGCMYV